MRVSGIQYRRRRPIEKGLLGSFWRVMTEHSWVISGRAGTSEDGVEMKNMNLCKISVNKRITW